MAIGFELGLILLLILINGILSMSEIAIVSARKARLEKMAEEGDRHARTALQLATEPDQLLSTVQVGITLVGTLAGAFGGAAVAEPLAAWLSRWPLLAPHSETLAVGLVVVAITYLSVVLGELVPKRLALQRPELIAAAVAGPMRRLAKSTAPIVRLLSASTSFVLWAFRIKPSEDPVVTEDEIRVLIRQGTQVGVFEQVEQSMVERVFRLGDRRVSTLMTPRTDVVWVDLADSVEESCRKMVASGHSCFPVCRGSHDEIVGVACVKRLWGDVVDGRPVDLESALLQPLFVPESVSALRLLERFKQAGTHIALVIDEYGGFQGMVTLNDMLGAIVGDVTWSDAGEAPQIVQREDGSWLLDGMLPTDELKELLGLRQLPGEDEGGYQTVGGFMMAHFGRIPHEGDHFAWEQLRFEIMDMDERRVDKVLVTRLP